MRYYEKIESWEDVKRVLNLPSYIDEIIVLDEFRKNLLDNILKEICAGKRILIKGNCGVGKTVFLAVILKNLISKGYKIGKILRSAQELLNKHTEEGIILFYDEISQLKPSALQSMKYINSVICTCSTENIPRIKDMLGITQLEDIFQIYTLKPFDLEYIKQIFRNYISIKKMQFEEKVDEIIAKRVLKENGNLHYLVSIINDLELKKVKKISRAILGKIPATIYNYIDQILWSALKDLSDKDREDILLVLRIMCDMPEYKIKKDILYILYDDIIDGKATRAFEHIIKYLIYNPDDDSFRLPNVAWIKVLSGIEPKDGLLKINIDRINRMYKYYERMNLLQMANMEAYLKKGLHSIVQEQFKEIQFGTEQREFNMLVRKLNTITETTLPEELFVETKVSKCVSKGLPPIEIARKLLTSKKFIRIDEFKKYRKIIQEAIDALCKLGEAIKREYGIYHRQYLRKIEGFIENELKSGKAIRIDQLSKLVDPRDIKLGIIMGKYIISKDKAKKILGDVLSKINKISTDTLRAMLNLNKIPRDIVPKSAIILGSWIVNKNWLLNRGSEISTLLKQGYTITKVSLLYGLDKKFAKLLASKSSILRNVQNKKRKELLKQYLISLLNKGVEDSKLTLLGLALANKGTEDTELLEIITKIKDTNLVGYKGLAIGALFESSNNEKICQILYDMWKKSNLKTRGDLLLGISLVNHGTKDAFVLSALKNIMSIYRYNEYSDVFIKAALAVGISFKGSGDLEALNTLKQLLLITNPSLRMPIHLSIGMLFANTEDTHIDIINSLINSNKPSIKDAGIISLGFAYIGCETLNIDNLENYLKDVPPETSIAKIVSVGLANFETKNEKITKNLIQLLKKNHSALNNAIILALGLINVRSGDDFILNTLLSRLNTEMDPLSRLYILSSISMVTAGHRSKYLDITKNLKIKVDQFAKMLLSVGTGVAWIGSQDERQLSELLKRALSENIWIKAGGILGMSYILNANEIFELTLNFMYPDIVYNRDLWPLFLVPIV